MVSLLEFLLFPFLSLPPFIVAAVRTNCDGYRLVRMKVVGKLISQVRHLVSNELKNPLLFRNFDSTGLKKTRKQKSNKNRIHLYVPVNGVCCGERQQMRYNSQIPSYAVERVVHCLHMAHTLFHAHTYEHE